LSPRKLTTGCYSPKWLRVRRGAAEIFSSSILLSTRAAMPIVVSLGGCATDKNRNHQLCQPEAIRLSLSCQQPLPPPNGEGLTKLKVGYAV
jgi:hypothetical protein